MTAHEITTAARNAGFTAVTSADGRRVLIGLTHQTVNIMDVQIVIGFENTMTRSGNGVIVTAK
jgi:hypothetical protein